MRGSSTRGKKRGLPTSLLALATLLPVTGAKSAPAASPDSQQQHVTWSRWDGAYLTPYSRYANCELGASRDLVSAQNLCAIDPLCSAIARDNAICDGKYRHTRKVDSDSIAFADQGAGMEVFTLNRPNLQREVKEDDQLRAVGTPMTDRARRDLHALDTPSPPPPSPPPPSPPPPSPPPPSPPPSSLPDPDPSPSPDPEPKDSAAPRTSPATACANTPTAWMAANGLTCEQWTFGIKTYCSKSSAWIAGSICQLACFEVGFGYPGDVCVASSPPPPPMLPPGVCTNTPTAWMTKNGLDCSWEYGIETYCSKSDLWTAGSVCQLACFEAGFGYPGDACAFSPLEPSPEPGQLDIPTE